MKLALTLVAGMLLLVGAVNAQPAYKLSGEGQSIKMSGTSTMHQWAMYSSTFSGDAQFKFKAGKANELASIKSLTFALPVTSLKSGERKLDNNAYKALKTEEHSNILYKLTSATITVMSADNYLVKTHGDMSIAGVTKNIAMDVYCTVNADKSISCKGTNKMNMSDYDVTPPTFMAGIMKTGDAITLDFTVRYKQ